MSHRTCQYCDYCTDADMRCMNTESQWAGCTVKPDNYCRLFTLRSCLSPPEFRKYLIDLSIDGLKEDVEELYEFIKAKEQGRIKFVKKPPEGAYCGNCADFVRIEGTARGTCRTQKRKRCGHYNEFRQVAQSTNACAEFKPAAAVPQVRKNKTDWRLREMNQIDFEQRCKVYTDALIAYGDRAQMIVAVEELSECQKEICKILRGGENFPHLAEEIADATIMLEQVRQMFNLNEAVCEHMDRKIERLKERLRKDSGGADGV